VVDDVLADLGVQHLPMVYVFNKMDRLEPLDAEALRARIENLAPGSVFTSAANAEGLEPLRGLLREALRNRRPEVTLAIPITDGRLLAEAHRVGEQVQSAPDETGAVMRVRGRYEAGALARLERAGAVRHP